MVLQRVSQPKTRRTKAALLEREPKIIENTKTCMFVKGGNTSDVVGAALKELYLLKKPDAVSYRKRNILRPFEDQTSLEFFGKKSDASLFLFGSHNKKRPHNLVFGRFFNFEILDMYEVGISKFKSMAEISKTAKPTLGNKPCLIFHGESFDKDPDMQKFKSLLIDLFRGPVVPAVRLRGLETVLSFTAVEKKVHVRGFKTVLKKSGTATPRVELEEVGPSLDLDLRRTRIGSDDLFRRAMKRPKAAKAKKVKNLSKDPFENKLGRIHLGVQDLSKLHLRKRKALKKSSEEKKRQKMTNRENQDTFENGATASAAAAAAAAAATAPEKKGVKDVQVIKDMET